MTPLLAQRLRTDRSFERLYRRYVADVYHYALAVCRNPADAEDVTQTTFMNAYRAVQSGEQPRAPKNWLLAIAHNVMRQRFRASSRRPSEVELVDDVAAAVPDDDGYSAEDIRRALSELNFNQRAALVMRELEGRTYAEIADILGVSIGAVETLIFRARRALREQLEESLTCREAELAISRQLDGRLSRAEKGALRAHLRTCAECSTFARRQRAQRTALKGLGAVPLPASLTSLFGGGAAVGTTVAAKAAAVTALGLLVAGGSVEAARHVRHHAKPAAAAAPRVVKRTTAVAALAASPPVSPRAAPDELGTAKPVTPPKRIEKLHARRRNHGRVAHPAAAPRASVVAAQPTLPPTSNGRRGRRAHGAPAVHHTVRPTPPAHSKVHLHVVRSHPAQSHAHVVRKHPAQSHAHVVHTHPAQSHATPAPAGGHATAPGPTSTNGNGKASPPPARTTPTVQSVDHGGGGGKQTP